MVNLPYQGHMNPTLATVRTLMGKGYRVDYIADPRWREAVEATGARFISYDSYSEHPGRFESSVKSIAQAARTLTSGQGGKVQRIALRGLLRLRQDTGRPTQAALHPPQLHLRIHAQSLGNNHRHRRLACLAHAQGRLGVEAAFPPDASPGVDRER